MAWMNQNINVPHVTENPNFATFCLMEAEQIGGTQYTTYGQLIAAANASPRMRTYAIVVTETYSDIATEFVPKDLSPEFMALWHEGRFLVYTKFNKTFQTMSDDDWFDFEVFVTPRSLSYRFAKEYRIWQSLYHLIPESPDDPMRRLHYNYLNGLDVSQNTLDAAGISRKEFAQYLKDGRSLDKARRSKLVTLVSEQTRLKRERR